MHKGFLVAGAIFGAVAVALGAFGAHGLKQIVPPETVTSFQTGVQYQMYHAIALLLAAVIFEKFPNKWMTRAGIAFICGIAFFSGSLYLLTLMKAVDQVGLRGIGVITPFGGVFFILGWALLIVGVVKNKE
jgi:uncharacterized membrane protein YgdD (TMEM256/DUF423 family)